MNTDLVNSDLTTTSLKLAELFGREVKSINRTIRNIIRDFDDEKLRRCNIALSSYNQKMPNGGVKVVDYFILGEEMTLIVTGRLTGKKALECQMRLAEAFIAMRNYIRNQSKIELDSFQEKLLEQSNKLEAIERREPRDEKSLAVIMGIPSYYVRPVHDLLERNGYLTRETFTQTYHTYSATPKLGQLCIGKKGNTLLYDGKVKSLVKLLLDTESLFAS